MTHWQSLKIDPQCKAILEILEEKKKVAPPLRQIPLATLREGSISFWQSLTHKPENVEYIQNQTVQGRHGQIPIRLYFPKNTDRSKPAIVYFHGGGHCLLNLETHDPVCRTLCVKTEMVVMSVDYRLAPENPYPIGFEDCLDATQWLIENALTLNIDPNRIAVCGDSAGGNLAALMAISARDGKIPKIALQVLIYPNVDFSRSAESHRKNDGILLDQDKLDYYYGLYLPAHIDVKDPHVSPLWLKDKSKLAPAFILSAEFDPLCNEVEAYAAALEKSGVTVRLKRYNGLIHGFINMGGVVDQAMAALLELCEMIKGAL